MRTDPADWLLSPLLLAGKRKEEAIELITRRIAEVNKGIGIPPRYRKKAAFLRQLKKELADRQALPPEKFLDVWNELIDAKYARAPFNAELLETLPDRGDRSVRVQGAETLAEAGFTLRDGVWFPAVCRHCGFAIIRDAQGSWTDKTAGDCCPETNEPHTP